LDPAPIDREPQKPEDPKPDEDEKEDRPPPERIECNNQGRYFCRSRGTPQKGKRQMTNLDAHDWGKSRNRGLKYIHDSEARQNYFSRANAKSNSERDEITRKEDKLNALAVRILQRHFKADEYDCEPDCVVKFPEPILRPDPGYPWKPVPWWPNPTPVDKPQCTNSTDGGDENGNGAWGLDRIDQPNLKLTDSPLDGSYDRHCVCCGLERTVVFVIDTGVQEHCELGQRLLVSEGRSFDPEDGTSTPLDPPKQESGDTHGHGTHVAGTIGGCNVGVNVCTNIVGLRVFPKNSGSTWRSWIIAAIDYVTEKALNASGDDSLANFHKTINMSVGGGYSTAYESAIDDAYDAGVTVVVAAGNSAQDACNSSPSHVKKAITVGATTITDNIASYSNWGSCVDIFAPGSDIFSAHENTGETAINMDESCEYTDMSGTSMASPHVAGVASLAHAYGLASTPGNTWQFIKCTAFNGKILNTGSYTDTVNRLLRVDLKENAYPCLKLAPLKPITFVPAPPH